MSAVSSSQAMQAETVKIVAGQDGTVFMASALPFEVPQGCVHDLVAHWAEADPDRPVLMERDSGDTHWTGLTYSRLWADACALGRSLLAMGLDADHPLLILAPNSADHLTIAMAAQRAGIVYAPVTPAYLLSEGGRSKLAAVLDALKPRAVFLPDVSSAALAETVELLGGTIKILATGADTILGALDLRQLIADGGSDELPQLPPSDPDAIVKLVFTSGSTGAPKGVITTNTMLRSDVEMVRAAWPILRDITPVVIDWLPWSHVFGGSLGLGLVLAGGGTLYIDNGKPAGAAYATSLRNIREVRPNLFWNVPKAYEMLRDAMQADAGLRDDFFSHLKFMFYGAASVAKVVGDDLENLAAAANGKPVPLVPAWGLTETTCVASAARVSRDIDGYIGLPLPGCIVKLVPASGKTEIRVKGPNVMPGYWARPEINAEAFDEDGFFRTGDAVRFVDDAKPELGLIFDGRLSEDFKLSTGTWVDVAGLQKRMRTALAGLALDIVITAPDRDYLGLVVFPETGAMHRSREYRQALRERIAAANGTVTASSRRIAAAIVADEPASAVHGELTDKGSINSRLILSRRRPLIDRLYDPADPEVIRL